MSQLKLLKVIVSTPNIYSTEENRAIARMNLYAKMKRRDRMIAKLTQTYLDFNKLINEKRKRKGKKKTSKRKGRKGVNRSRSRKKVRTSKSK